MLIPEDTEELKFLMQAMAEARIPIDHLWIGGKIEDGVWKWHPRDQPGEEIPLIPNETNFLPWCDNEIILEQGCLNLDRQNHWTPLMYGLECNATQAVVCVEHTK